MLYESLMQGAAVDEILRSIVTKVAKLPATSDVLGRDDDLFDRGLTSFACVQLMLSVEETFDIEFPDALMSRQSFTSLAKLASTIEQIRTMQPA